MSFGWIISLIWKLIGLFGGKGSRITFEARTEASIEAEQKKLDKLKYNIQEIDDELQKTVIKLVQAKSRDDIAAANRLDDKRQYLMSKLRDAKQRYDDAKRRAS
jgi:hypothetical protein